MDGAGVPEGVAARLGPGAEPVWPLAHVDLADQVPVRGGQHVDAAVVAAGEPELRPVRRHVAHVRALTARDRPLTCLQPAAARFSACRTVSAPATPSRRLPHRLGVRPEALG
jgi:hypothetical protein